MVSLALLIFLRESVVLGRRLKVLVVNVFLQASGIYILKKLTWQTIKIPIV